MTDVASPWSPVVTWWDGYVRRQRADLVDLRETLDALDAA